MRNLTIETVDVVRTHKTSNKFTILVAQVVRQNLFVMINMRTEKHLLN